MTDGHLGVGGRLASGPADELVRAGYAGETAAGPALAEGMSRSDLAHAIQLVESGALDRERGAALLRGLLELDAIDPAAFAWDPSVGDAFQNREAELTRLVGADAAGWLSAGRPRREPFRVALRLVTATGLAATADRFAELADGLAGQSEPLAGSLAADYTYLQPAQPTTAGHLLLAWAYPVLRSAERYRRVQGDFAGSVAGVGGSAGSRWPLDRERLAELLGHERVEEHAKDAMWQSDPYLVVLSGLAIGAASVSQLAQDLEIWCSQEFGWVELDDAHSRVSALMPQKKNPYALAVLRTWAGQAAGDLTAALTTMHTGAARTDHFHLLNGLIPRALDEAERMGALGAAVARGMRVDAARMERSAREAFVTAADVADMLAQTTGLDYRTAHHVIGRVVRDQVETGAPIDAAAIAAAANEIAGAEVAVDEAALVAALDPAACAALRPQTGGSDPAEVRRMCADVRERCADVRVWAAEVREADAGAAAALRERARELAGA
ncbi:MAG: argininosuccinate lyase [Actinobacteria bacterium]|nr:argininosuccinate lyase [Actinomycetota bacterium]